MPLAYLWSAQHPEQANCHKTLRAWAHFRHFIAQLNTQTGKLPQNSVSLSIFRAFHYSTQHQNRQIATKQCELEHISGISLLSSTPEQANCRKTVRAWAHFGHFIAQLNTRTGKLPQNSASLSTFRAIHYSACILIAIRYSSKSQGIVFQDGGE